MGREWYTDLTMVVNCPGSVTTPNTVIPTLEKVKECQLSPSSQENCS